MTCLLFVIENEFFYKNSTNCVFETNKIGIITFIKSELTEARGAQIPHVKSPQRLNTLWQILIFCGSQSGTSIR